MKKIVRGNDFTLRIPVRKIVNGEQVSFPLSDCTDIAVHVVSKYKRTVLPYTIDKATRVGLMNSTTIAQSSGLLKVTLWFGDTQLILTCDKAISLLSAIEMYAVQCFDTTARHKAAIGNLTTIEEVEKYDITAGYPEKLEITTYD